LIRLSLILLLLICFVKAAWPQSAEEQKLFSFINTERKRENIPTLKWNPDLYRVAIAHSKDMASMNRADHTGTDGREPHQRLSHAGIFASKTAENIARDVNVVSAHTLLMQSLYHRENILEPEFTDCAVAAFPKGSLLYITEVFIRRVPELSVREARRQLLDTFNHLRGRKKQDPLAFSEALSNVAQSHVDVQQKFDSKTPLLTMSVLVHQLKRSVLVTVYTTSDVASIPDNVEESLLGNHRIAGVGFKRIRGSLCESGCYFIAVILS
jgi:uncharacterized protein YkwD